MVMRALKSRDPERQKLWNHKGRKYSVVNLVRAPLEANGHRASERLWSKFEEIMASSYGTQCYELYCFDTGEVIGRYTSFDEAKEAIHDYAASKLN